MRPTIKVALGNAGVNLISLVNGVLFTGLLSRLVGIEDFAMWNWINSTVSLCAISDMYLVYFVQNLITRHFALGRRRFADFVFRSMFPLQLGFAALLAVIILLMVGSLRAANPHALSETLWTLFVVALITQLASQGLSIFGAYYTARGDSDKSNFMLLIKAVAQNTVLILALCFKVGFIVGVLLFYLSGPVLLVLFHWKGNITYRPNSFGLKWHHLSWTLAYLWRRARLPVWGGVRIMDAVRNNIPLVLGYFALAGTAIADYVFVSRLNTVALILATALFSPLVPKIVALQAKEEWRELRHFVVRATAVTVAFGIAYCVGMIIAAEFVTSLWAGRHIYLQSTFVALIALGGVMQVVQSLLWNVMLGLNKVSELLKLSTVACVTTVLVLYAGLRGWAGNALPVAVLAGNIVFCIQSSLAVRMSISKSNQNLSLRETEF